MVKMKKLLNLFLVLLVFPFQIFGIHPMLEEANHLYRDKQYVTAFRKFSTFLYKYGIHSEAEDYYIALIGMNCCYGHIDSQEMYHFFQCYMKKVMNAEMTPAERGHLRYIFDNSVFDLDFQ